MNLDRGKIIHVITLRNKKDEDEVTGHAEICKDEVACLYKDRNGTFIVKKSGITIKVKHSLEELRPYFDL